MRTENISNPSLTKRIKKPRKRKNNQRKRTISENKTKVTADDLWYEICSKRHYPLHKCSIGYIKGIQALWYNHVNFKDMQVGRVSTKHWRNLVLDYRDAGRYGTAKSIISLCGTFYKNAQQHRDFGNLVNPLTGIYIDLPNAKVKKVFTLDQLRQFSLENELANIACKVMILTGQRISEVVRMRWDNLVDDVWIVGEKGQMKRKDSSHVLPLTKGVSDLIEPLRDNGEWVFQSRTNKGHQVRRLLISKNLKREYPGFSPHCFRHSLASHAADAGIDPYGISLVLHHAIPGMTSKVYMHGQQLSSKLAVLEAWEKVING